MTASPAETTAALPEGERRPWHKPTLRRFAAATAGTKVASTAIDGGGGVMRSS